MGMAKTRDERTDSSELPLVSNLSVTVCLWHPPENCSKVLLCLKKGSVPGQTCFSILGDKPVQGTVPWAALLSSCQAHFNCVSSLICLHI